MSLCTVGRTRLLCSNVSFFLQWITFFCHTRIGRYTVTPGPTVNRTIAFLVALPPCGQKAPFGLGLFIYVRALCGKMGLAQRLFYFILHCPHQGLATGYAPTGHGVCATLSHRQIHHIRRVPLPATACLFFCGPPYGSCPAQKHRFARLPVLVKVDIVLHPKWPSPLHNLLFAATARGTHPHKGCPWVFPHTSADYVSTTVFARRYKQATPDTLFITLAWCFWQFSVYALAL
ncbi:hypothetical protein SDC9_111542 [bioreactor metagenome]|uniref:Uncharacterized protein n=1 Tax=bioreactor metagenome TaxID=1076179 RepID=A0A645BS82_9ZZZZ